MSDASSLNDEGQRRQSYVSYGSNESLHDQTAEVRSSLGTESASNLSRYEDIQTRGSRELSASSPGINAGTGSTSNFSRNTPTSIQSSTPGDRLCRVRYSVAN